MQAASNTRIVPAHFPADVGVVRELFVEYSESLGIDLSFQGFQQELAQLPGKYAPPLGEVLLARDGTGPVLGCVALRPTAMSGTGEIKRLYVQPAARGQALGCRLAEAIIERARAAGHARLVLDTLASMQAAQRLYARLGFRPVPPYYDNPLTGTQYMALELELRQVSR